MTNNFEHITRQKTEYLKATETQTQKETRKETNKTLTDRVAKKAQKIRTHTQEALKRINNQSKTLNKTLQL